MNDSITKAQIEVTQFRDERDWKQFHTPKELAAALAIEAAELQQELLWKSAEEITELLQHSQHREAIADELADIFAYLLAFADITGINLGKALEEKMKKNRLKYPVEKAKGRHDKYSAYRSKKN